MGITVDGNKDKEYIRIFNKWRDYDFMCCIMATLGLVVQIINYEMDWGSSYKPLNPELY